MGVDKLSVNTSVSKHGLPGPCKSTLWCWIWTNMVGCKQFFTCFQKNLLNVECLFTFSLSYLWFRIHKSFLENINDKIIKLKSSSVGIIPSFQLLAGRVGCVKSQAEGCGATGLGLSCFPWKQDLRKEGRKERRIFHEHPLCASAFTFRILLSLSDALCSGHFISSSLMKRLETGNHSSGL